MSDKYVLKEDAFQIFMDGSPEELKTAIINAKDYVINARRFPFRYPSQKRRYDEQHNLWKALEWLEKLKCNFITIEDFDSKVIIDKGIPND
jgi:hypothetical protein